MFLVEIGGKGSFLLLFMCSTGGRTGRFFVYGHVHGDHIFLLEFLQSQSLELNGLFSLVSYRFKSVSLSGLHL